MASTLPPVKCNLKFSTLPNNLIADVLPLVSCHVVLYPAGQLQCSAGHHLAEVHEQTCHFLNPSVKADDGHAQKEIQHLTEENERLRQELLSLQTKRKGPKSKVDSSEPNPVTEFVFTSAGGGCWHIREGCVANRANRQIQRWKPCSFCVPRPTKDD